MSLLTEYIGNGNTSVLLITIRYAWSVTELVTTISNILIDINEIPVITDLVLDFTGSANTFYTQNHNHQVNVRNFSELANLRQVIIVSNLNFPEKIANLFKLIFTNYQVVFVNSLEEAIIIINTDNEMH